MQVAVIGAGSWGTTIADLVARNGHRVAIWAYETEVVDSINGQHENAVFLPGASLAPGIVAHRDIADAVSEAELVVSASPSHAVRSVTGEVGGALRGRTPLVVSLSKGIEEGTDAFMSAILCETMPGCAVTVVSGPSFAREVFEQQPTALVAASRDHAAAEEVQRVLSNGYFRVYTSADVCGVELGGSLKNVIALAAGILEGLGLGSNPRAALITRGLAEMARLGDALGADARTFAGLAGMGDLLLTATGTQSRNHSLGVELGKGRALDAVLAERRSVAEGVRTARTAVDLAERVKVELPIASEVSRILFDGKSPKQAIDHLMGRELRAEHDR
ncbi:MAG TPA: NAD(P)H-dependent glycerol-3-phosphate dehydrogenase [Gemmatimonadales bacterium]